jgi:hypothetical protein
MTGRHGDARQTLPFILGGKENRLLPQVNAATTHSGGRSGDMEAAAQKLRQCERRTAVWGWVTIFLFLSGEYNHPWTLAPDYRPGLEWGQWTIHAMWWTLLIAAAYWALLAVCFVQWLSWHDGVIRLSGRQPPLERTGSIPD